MKEQSNRIIKKMFGQTFMVMLINSIVLMLGMLIDGIMISSQLGSRSMAEYGLINPIVLILYALGGIICTGSQTICAREMGKGNLKEANESFSLAILLTILSSSLIMILCILFHNPIVRVLGAHGDMVEGASHYLIGLAIGFPATVIVSVLGPYMQLDGDRSRSVKAIAVMTVVNVIGDILSVQVFHGGMFGMGLATSVSGYAALAVLLTHFRKKDIILHFEPHMSLFRQTKAVLVPGIPTAMARVYFMLRIFLANRLLIVISSAAALSAFAVRNNLQNIFNAIGGALGMAALMLAGLLSGEMDRTSLKNLLKLSVRWSLVFNAVVMILLLVGAPAFVGIYFAPGTEEATMAVTALRWYAFSIPIFSLNTVYAGYYQATKKIVLSNVIYACQSVVIGLPYAWLLGGILKETAVWSLFLVGEVVTFLGVLIYCMVKEKKGTLLERTMLLSEEETVRQEDIFECSISCDEDMKAVILDLDRFCKDHGTDSRMNYVLVLAAEEMIRNVISYGFSDGKKHSVDIRVVKKDNKYVLRIRDDCRPFNPKHQYEIMNSQDKISNFGIRMICTMAADVRYVCTMRMNHLIVTVE